MTVSLVQINEHFICTICKGYLRNAHTIKECLHTCTYDTSGSHTREPSGS